MSSIIARVRPRGQWNRIEKKIVGSSCSRSINWPSNNGSFPRFQQTCRNFSSEPSSVVSSSQSLWSLDRLTHIPTASATGDDATDNGDITKYNSLFFELVQDITLRLEQQQEMLVELEELVSSSEKKDDSQQQLDRAFKTIRDFRHLHKDTHKKCSMLLPALQKQLEQPENSSIDPLLLLNHTQQTLQETYTRHSLTMESLAETVIQVRAVLKDSSTWNERILKFLQRRVGLQLLAEHGSLLAKQQLKPPKQQDQKMGVVSNEISAWELVDQSVTEAKHLCEAHYLHSPSVVGIPSDSSPASSIPVSLSALSVETSSGESDDSSSSNSPKFTYVRPWLQFALVEILKNCMAITVDRKLMAAGVDGPQHYYETSKNANEQQNQNDNEEESFGLNPIFVQVHETQDFVEIEILDQAGGIEGNVDSNDLFSFCQTQKIWDRMDDQQTYAMTRSPLQGLGVGLCMSRMYLQHFGGTLELENRQEEDKMEVKNASPLTLSRGVTSTLRIPKDTSILEENLH